MPSAEPSFDQFVAAHVRDLMSTAYLISCDESEAEDLVQECLLKVATRWRRVRAMERPVAYARRVLVSLASIAVVSSTARGLARMREIVEPPPTYTRDAASRSGSSEP